LTLAITDELLARHKLSRAEYAEIVRILGRQPNLVELGIFSVMWSEHCSYKSSKIHLKKFPTTAPWVVCGPGENAGVVDIGDGLVAVFKMESHNHPSFIEPYQGAATGVGGILRDVFTMGARPVALLDALRFGRPQAPRMRHLVSGVVAGIGGYGNCVGVPTVGGECTFHPAYDGNILVNVMCVGIARADRVFYARAAGIGNPVVYIGAKTGRDGIHGATMASAEFSEADRSLRPTVQVGDPFTEKLLIEACLELMETGSIVAIQDMGAAGLTSSSFEMAARGGTGIELDLDAVPLREAGMTAYEIMLSESQERMLLVAAAGREAEAFRICRKWGLDVAVVGRVTDTGRMVIRHRGEVVADLPVAPVSGASPVYDRPTAPLPRPLPIVAEAIRAPLDPPQALLRLLGSPDLSSKRWIFEQYDWLVGADTIVPPGLGAAVVRVHGTRKALALTTDCTPRYCAADPRTGGMQAVAEAWRNLVAVGARPLAITDCLNFGNPERPAIMAQLVAAIEGMAEACRALGFPVVSGNVSLYNETDGRAILPTPQVGGLGLIEDVARLVRPDAARAGDRLLLVGESTGWLGASLFLREILGREEGAPPPVDLVVERRNGAFVSDQMRAGRVRACQDLADGGLAVALAELCLAAGTGATVDPAPSAEAETGWWFGEDQGRYLLAVPADHAVELLAAAAAAGVLARAIGTFGGDALTLGRHPPISLRAMQRAREGWLPAWMGETSGAKG
jgi:phosphoribosylformylglycinamidine synthase II